MMQCADRERDVVVFAAKAARRGDRIAFLGWRCEASSMQGAEISTPLISSNRLASRGAAFRPRIRRQVDAGVGRRPATRSTRLRRSSFACMKKSCGSPEKSIED